MWVKSRQQPVGPIFHVAPVRREIAVELQAFQNLNAAEILHDFLYNCRNGICIRNVALICLCLYAQSFQFLYGFLRLRGIARI